MSVLSRPPRAYLRQLQDYYMSVLSRPPRAALIVFLLGFLTTAVAGFSINHIQAVKEEMRFSTAVDDTVMRLEVRLNTYSTLLRSAAGLFAATPGLVTRGQFKAFADELDLRATYPGIQGLGFSLKTPDGEGPQTRLLLERVGLPDLRFRSARHPGEDLHAIVYLEPLDRRNRAAIGFDMFADPTRREAMARARDTGEAALSRKVQLVQEIDEQRQAGFLLYYPVYEGGRTPLYVEGRRQNLIGFVYSPFRADDLMAGVFGVTGHADLEFAVYDGAVSEQNLLHRSFSGPETEIAKSAVATATRTLHVGGGKWTVVVHATDTFDRGSNREIVLIVILIGLLATGLITGATWRESLARLVAEQEVESRIKLEEQRLTVIGELNHRVKNSLAAVQAIAALTIRDDSDPREARIGFTSRLMALSRAHNLLNKESWGGLNLRDLISLELTPYDRGWNVSLDGPPVQFNPDQGIAVVLMLHELTMNAAKYGALSVPGGCIHVSWTFCEQNLHLTWKESGGPRVQSPSRRGFGSRMIQDGIRRQLGGQVDLQFLAEGVQCDLRFSVSEKGSGSKPA
jgi:CHASE1-domain containing sensor protein